MSAAREIELGLIETSSNGGKPAIETGREDKIICGIDTVIEVDAKRTESRETEDLSDREV
jgi:hypothetical protein